jgi:Uma2 family endonuclease
MLGDMSDPSEKKPRATYQDVLDAPEHKVAEIINGELHLSPRPGAPHTAVASALSGELSLPFGRGRGGPGGWIILSEPELHFDDDILVPDLAGWKRERMPFVPDSPFFTLAPDWVCEVLSKSTERRDRLDKLPIYARAGVQHAWLVNPFARSIEVFRRNADSWIVIGAHKNLERARIEPFDAIEINLADLWHDLPLPTRASEGHWGYYTFEGS